jgi:DNA-binding transcriptional ArsR family regulator
LYKCLSRDGSGVQSPARFYATPDPRVAPNGDLNAGEIADAFSISKPSISHHLDLLRQAGLVSSRREGQFIIYSLETTVLDESIGWILGLVQSRTQNNENIPVRQK